jgi:glucose-6-phosphate isomerase
MSGSILYDHDIEGCLAETIGEAGLEADELEAALARGEPALERLRDRHNEGSLPLLLLPARRDDLAELGALAGEFRRRFDHVLVLGIGGSSLGGQTVMALADQGFGPRPGAPRLHFMENIDPASFDALFAAIDPARTGIIAISKSGGTAETLAQLLASLDWLRQSLGSSALGDRLIVITEPRDSPLHRLAAAQQARILAHDPGIGGRYSVLSNVGSLPALIAGLDAAALREGAAGVLDATLAAREPRDSAPALGAAIAVALAERRGIGVTVLMPYVDRLAPFGLWYRQLWAESLGKDGKGTTPVRAVGVVDQHSQLQLYLDGPADKLFTLVLLNQDGRGAALPPDLAADRDLAYLAGRRMGDLLAAEQRATATSLLRNGRPTRVMRLERLDEKSLGALFMHFMLETIIAADFLGVDAFDQPAVEEGKVLARQYLGESRRGGAQ